MQDYQDTNDYQLHVTVPEVEVKEFLPVRQKVKLSFEAALHGSDSGFSFFATGQLAAIGKIQALLAEYDLPSADTVIVVGIGGSSLGSKAVYHALQGSGALAGPAKMIFCDTIDSLTVAYALRAIDETVDAGGTTVVCIISKSGNTTEAVVNARIVSQHMAKCYGPNQWSRQTVVLSEKTSKLFTCAQELGCCTIALDPAVGGRFSVFSPVGIVPLLLARMPAQELARGAEHVTATTLANDPDDDRAFRYAVWLHQQYRAGRYVHDLFLFYPALNALGAWYRQLFAESLGKKTHARQPVGIVPTVSIGTIDLHSMVQLYLSGPDVYSGMIVDVREQDKAFSLSVEQPFASVLPELNGLTNQKIYSTICQGTKEAFSMCSRPFCSLSFNAVNLATLGEFFQLYMVTVVYLAHILKVNPFDQPEVELYKSEARRILRGE